MNIETTFFLFLWYCVWNYREIFLHDTGYLFHEIKKCRIYTFLWLYIFFGINRFDLDTIYFLPYFVNNIFLNFNIKDKILGVIIISYDPIQILCISSTFKICYWILYYYVTICSLNHISKFMHLLYSI